MKSSIMIIFNQILYRHLRLNKNIKKNVTCSLFRLKTKFYDLTKNTSPWSNGDSKSNFFLKSDSTRQVT